MKFEPESRLEFLGKRFAGFRRCATPLTFSLAGVDGKFAVPEAGAITMSKTEPVIKWSYLTRGRIGRASPAVAGDGNVYIGDNENYFYAISSEGKLIWRHKVPGRLGDATSSIADDGTALITTETGRLYAVSPEGEILWASNGDWLAVTSPITTSDGLAIVGAKKPGLTNGQYERLAAVDRWGNTVWEISTQGEVGDAPVIDADGTIYFGTQRGYFYAVTPDGNVKWHFRLGGRITSSPAITAEGLALIGSQDGYLFAVSPNWEIVWNYYAGEMIRHASPAVATDGTIYFGCCDHCFYALTSTGRLKWKFITERPVSSSPAVAANGTIYFSSQDKHFYALYPDGRLKWTLQTDSPLTTSPAITEEGDVIICNQNRCVMSLAEQNGGTAIFGWPQLLGNSRRNGRPGKWDACNRWAERGISGVTSSQSVREAREDPPPGVTHRNL